MSAVFIGTSLNLFIVNLLFDRLGEVVAVSCGTVHVVPFVVGSAFPRSFIAIMPDQPHAPITPLVAVGGGCDRLIARFTMQFRHFVLLLAFDTGCAIMPHATAEAASTDTE
jgi:hypothetical protein